MYKILRSDIKEFRPSEEELKSIFEITQTHSYTHAGDNRTGEVYEVWVHSWLSFWARKNSCVSLYSLKGCEYVGRKYKNIGYDSNGQIIVCRNGRKIAEYDGLFIYKDCVIFVETSVSENRKYFRNLEEKLEKKRELLRDIFKTDEVYCLLVTRPGKKTIKYRLLPFLVNLTLQYPRDIDLGMKGPQKVLCDTFETPDERFTDIENLVHKFFKRVSRKLES